MVPRHTYLFFLTITWLCAETQIYLAPHLSFPLGKTSTYFSSGFGAELFLRRKVDSIPFFGSISYPITPFLGLVYTDFGMEQYRASHIKFYEFLGGAGYEIKLPYSLSLYPHLGLGGYYANFVMANQSKSIQMGNPVFYLGNSLLFLVQREIYLEFTQSYFANYVGSPSFFQRITLSLGITLRLGLPPMILTQQNPTQELQANIISHYEQGNYDQALLEIDALEKIAPEDVVIEKYRSLIFQQKKRQEAKLQLEAGRPFRAIALLKQATDIPEAIEELKSIRESLKSQVPFFVDQGISAYERSDFDSCIAFMEKVLLLDPENEQALIYLPRAQNRRKALQKLR